MKKLHAVIAFLLLVAIQQLPAQNRSIQFETGLWSEVKQKAEKESKMIFVDAFTTWCGPANGWQKRYSPTIPQQITTTPLL